MRLLKNQDRFHPCCGFSLQSIVPKVIPILQCVRNHLHTVFMTAGSIFIALGIFQNWQNWQQAKISNPINFYLRIVVWSGYGLHVIITDALAFLLWKACRSKNASLVRVWLVGTSLSTLLIVCTMLMNIFRFKSVQTSSQVFVLVSGYGFLQVYICYVVYIFMRELEVEVSMSSSVRELTDAEIKDFNEGVTPPFLTDDLDTGTKNLMDRIHYERYKKEDFEINRDNLVIDMENFLGSGEYGKVFKGVLKRPDGDQLVAIKTVDPDNTDVVCFKALLIELKVMTYLGKHPNVVRLVGASTTMIRSRDLLIVSEFCALGSMHTFLRGNRGLFRNLVKDGHLSPENSSSSVSDNYCNISIFEMEIISTKDLIRWSHEIALGMDYLHSMRVVHGDLALRNILLTDTKIAKLTDFGLARQLYNYSVYVKTQHTPLPWRWLSLESILDMNFSQSSDVWAFAVTLWEIFTMSEVPFPGYNFCFEFVQELKSGLRPSRPPYASSEIWSIMERSWTADPKSRPNFSEIACLIQNHLVNPV